jgi:hypothetical protein
MKRNDLNTPKPSADQSDSDRAFSLFVQRAIIEDRNYFSDLVKENLDNYLSAGKTPEEAVEALYNKANKL